MKCCFKGGCTLIQPTNLQPERERESEREREREKNLDETSNVTTISRDAVTENEHFGKLRALDRNIIGTQNELTKYW